MECSKQLFFFFCFFFLNIPQLSQSFVATVTAILEHVAGIKFKMSEYLHKKIRFISLNIKYLVFVLFLIEFKLKRTRF